MSNDSLGNARSSVFSNTQPWLTRGVVASISTRLLAGATAVVAQVENPGEALDGLIDFHLDFALGESDLIRIQDRDLAHLPPTAKRQVRKAQRQYVEIWVDVLRRLDNALGEDDARLMAHATFGLLNSTPHSVKPGAVKTAETNSRAVLRAMTVAAFASAGRAGYASVPHPAATDGPSDGPQDP